MMQPEAIARVCYETLRAIDEAAGIEPVVAWNQASRSARDTYIGGVHAALANRHLSAQDLHAVWMDDKLKAGWTYGPRADAEQKTHPALLPFDEMPPHQRTKDFVFVALVTALSRPS